MCVYACMYTCMHVRIHMGGPWSSVRQGMYAMLLIPWCVYVYVCIYVYTYTLDKVCILFLALDKVCMLFY